MIVAEGVLKAAQRWLRLLNRSTLRQASSIIRNDPRYTDLSPTQYASAFEWLMTTKLLHDEAIDVSLSFGNRGMPTTLIDERLFAHTLQELDPPWLVDADALVPDATELPQDAVDIAEILGLADSQAWMTTRRVHGKIDLAARARIGALGEAGLVRLLEEHRPGSTLHVALKNDGFGYDVLHVENDSQWHLEVKTTTRRGRLLIYLSRNEYEVALSDPTWRLVIVGLDDVGEPSTVATVQNGILSLRAPLDQGRETRWESARFELGAADLVPGLPFLSLGPVPDTANWIIDRGFRGSSIGHGWLQ